MSSPSVQTYERDRSFNVNSIESNASATVGLFRWGPVNSPVLITTNESELVRRFGRPDSNTEVSFLSAANYLLYSSPLYVVRAINSATGLNAVPPGNTPILVKNDAEYETADLTGISFIGRYPGELGNALVITMANNVGFDSWPASSYFNYAPREIGEFNVAVIDTTGVISGTPGTVLETYELMTLTEGSKKPDGTSAYLNKVLKDQSNYVLVGDNTEIDFDSSDSLGVYQVLLQGGVDGNTDVAYADAIMELYNSETIDIISMFASGLIDADKAFAIDMAEQRQDCVAFIAPNLSDIYNTGPEISPILDYFNTTINKSTSYGFCVDNWKLVYNKYDDKQVWIPCDSDAAGLWSRAFSQNEPWESPAGYNRGQLKNVIKLAWNPNKIQRHWLYKNSINSIISVPGEGTVLFGDKTMLKRPSATSRINVRGLLIVLKKSIASAAKYQLFELNDIITRTIFRNAVDRYLASVQGRRGINRYRVVCDETNNTAQVINSNEFVGDIYIDPARSINWIKLNFITVDAGVEFEEIEGAV